MSRQRRALCQGTDFNESKELVGRLIVRSWNVDPPSRHWGALQVAARYQALHVGRDAFTIGLAAPGASLARRRPSRSA